MKFLNKETEILLKKCIDNSSNFPKVLADMFEELPFEEEKRLRAQIKELIDNGYIANLQWADSVPWFGVITEDGYDYFHKKDVFIRAKLRQDPTFYLLDPSTEEYLKTINQNETPFPLQGTPAEAKIVESLKKNGYIDYGPNGFGRMLDGSFVADVYVTQAGKEYFTEKENRIEEILLLSENTTSVLNSGIRSEPAVPSKRKESARPVSSAQKMENELNIDKVFPKKDEHTLCFAGILGNNCGTVVPYTGADLQKIEKGFSVENGIPVLRGFAKMSELVKASHAQYEQYQRERDSKHVDEITQFLYSCKDEAKFLPEVILSVNDPSKASLTKYTHKSFSGISNTAKGAIENMDYYLLEVTEGALTRVDGNHRLEAGTESNYYVPFAIIVWNYDTNKEGNVLSIENEEGNTESEAFLFYILNNTAKRLEAEENFKGLVKSTNWSEEELAIINKQLPILKYFNATYAENPLLDRDALYAPLSQICEILTEINSPDLGKEEFDIVFIDAMKLLAQSDKFNYSRKHFQNIFFQLAFYTRYKSDNYDIAIRNLTLVDKWLEKYKYSSDTFTKASKIYDVAYKFIKLSPKYIFMAMEYKSEQIVADYNAALSRAVTTINDMGGNIEVEAYPIMTGTGKSFSITSDIYAKIENCSFFIADTTEANPNVMYELGLAYSKNKPIIMVREKGKHIKVPSDIISDYYYTFSGMTELENLFVTHITEILTKDYGAVFP